MKAGDWVEITDESGAVLDRGRVVAVLEDGTLGVELSEKAGDRLQWRHVSVSIDRVRVINLH